MHSEAVWRDGMNVILWRIECEGVCVCVCECVSEIASLSSNVSYIRSNFRSYWLK